MHLLLPVATILGSIERASYERALDAHQDALTACVAEQSDGSLTAKLIVTADCDVDRVFFSEAPEDAPTDCLRDALLALTESLPRSRCGCGIVVITQPIRWQASSPHETSGGSPD